MCVCVYVKRGERGGAMVEWVECMTRTNLLGETWMRDMVPWYWNSGAMHADAGAVRGREAETYYEGR